MAIHLDDLSLLTWLWHDAEMRGFTVAWDENAEIEVRLKTEINVEESSQPLIDIGIESAFVEVIFRRVWEIRTKVVGTYYPREVVQDWDTSDQSPSMQSIKAQGVTISPTAIHHQIQCSGGSIFDIICEEIWLDTF